MKKLFISLALAVGVFFLATSTTQAAISYSRSPSGANVDEPLTFDFTADDVSDLNCGVGSEAWALGFDAPPYTYFTEIVPLSTLSHEFTLASPTLRQDTNEPPYPFSNSAIAGGTGFVDAYVQCFNTDDPLNSETNPYTGGSDLLEGDGNSVVFTIGVASSGACEYGGTFAEDGACIVRNGLASVQDTAVGFLPIVLPASLILGGLGVALKFFL